MKKSRNAIVGELLTDVILTLFRVNNLALLWGDRLVAPFGLTSARWQLLGAIAFAAHPQPVSWLARDLGASRQNVQRIVNDLHKEGLVTFEPNPHHKRAHLVVMTDKGRSAYEAALAVYYPEAEELAAHFPAAELDATRRVLASLRARLEAEVHAGK